MEFLYIDSKVLSITEMNKDSKNLKTIPKYINYFENLTKLYLR